MIRGHTHTHKYSISDWLIDHGYSKVCPDVAAYYGHLSTFVLEAFCLTDPEIVPMSINFDDHIRAQKFDSNALEMVRRALLCNIE